MSVDKLSEMTNQELAKQITVLSLSQYETTYEEDDSRAVPEYNRLYKAIDAISDVLRARGLGARRALIPLLQHANPQVRLNAAHQLLAIVPIEARAVLEDLAQNGPGPQRLSAGMALMHLDNGVYKPS